MPISLWWVKWPPYTVVGLKTRDAVLAVAHEMHSPDQITIYGVGLVQDPAVALALNFEVLIGTGRKSSVLFVIQRNY